MTPLHDDAPGLWRLWQVATVAVFCAACWWVVPPLLRFAVWVVVVLCVAMGVV